MVGLLLLLLLVLSAGLIVALVFYLLREIRIQQSQKESASVSSLSQLPIEDRKLMRQLLAQIKQEYPGRSAAWYQDKAQRDLPLFKLHRQTTNYEGLKHPEAPGADPLPPLQKQVNQENPSQTLKKEKRQTQPRVSFAVQDKLYRLVNGDKKTAERLVEKAQLLYPDRSEQWCWEKVIWDLERDRFR